MGEASIYQDVAQLMSKEAGAMKDLGFETAAWAVAPAPAPGLVLLEKLQSTVSCDRKAKKNRKVDRTSPFRLVLGGLQSSPCPAFLACLAPARRHLGRSGG